MKLFTLAGIADELNVSRNTVYKWISAGLPVIRVPGSPPRFDIDAVSTWLKGFTVSQVRETPAAPEAPSPIPQETAQVPADRSAALPVGVRPCRPGGVVVIAYNVPDGSGKTRRIRESAQTYDIETAVQVRRERILKAWQNQPDSSLKERYLRKAEV